MGVVPQPELPTALWILLGVQTALLVLLWIVQLVHGARLRRILRQLKIAKPTDRREKLESRSDGGMFESWLDEDPSRQLLPKKEQFAAYRKWRAERGMTWNSPGSGS